MARCGQLRLRERTPMGYGPVIIDPVWGKNYHAEECRCQTCVEGIIRQDGSKMYPDQPNKKRGSRQNAV